MILMYWMNLIIIEVARSPPIQLHRAKLKSRFRRENKPVPQLAQDIRRLVRDANPGVPLEIRENMANDSFLDALNDRELELSVFQSQPKSLQDALRIALEIEAFYRSREKRVPLRSVKQNSESSLVQNDELVQSLQLRISKLEEELKSVHVSKSETNSVPQFRNKTQKTNKSKVVCFYCDKPRHIAKNCHKKYFDKKKKQDETSKHSKARVGGHMSADCSEGPKLNSCNDGLYLPCSISGVKVNCLIDTGANTSIIHPKKYYSIPERSRANLQTVTSNIRLADGGKIQPLGEVILPLFIPDVGTLYQNFLVAETNEPLVLGCDFSTNTNVLLT